MMFVMVCPVISSERMMLMPEPMSVARFRDSSAQALFWFSVPMMGTRSFAMSKKCLPLSVRPNVRAARIMAMMTATMTNQ